MTHIDLVPIDPVTEAALRDDPEYVSAMVDGHWDEVADIVHRRVGRTLPAGEAVADAPEWSGRFAVDAQTRTVVGSCGFKGPPSETGEVEIAYFTYPAFEGRGYATAMARALIERAAASEAVACVIAHTLPERNASARVLEKVGLTFVGEVTDPDDGQVWRWQKRVRG